VVEVVGVEVGVVGVEVGVVGVVISHAYTLSRETLAAASSRVNSEGLAARVVVTHTRGVPSLYV
jgi:hypothetical protein